MTMMMWVIRKIATAVTRKKKVFLLLFATGCLFHLLHHGSHDEDSTDAFQMQDPGFVGGENHKDEENEAEKLLSSTSEGKSESEKKNNRDEKYKTMEGRKSESSTNNEGEEELQKEKEGGKSSRDNIRQEDQRDKVGATTAMSFGKENHERTKIEDLSQNENYRNLTELPKSLKELDSERENAGKSQNDGSVFHVNQSNKYPSHDDDRIAYQVHLKIF